MKAVLLLSAALFAGTIQQPPPRDAEVKPTTGTGSVSGVVVTDENPARPIARAIVTLTGSGLVPSRGAISDDNGKFTLTGLPAGRFTLTAARAAFVTSVYGAKRPGRPGTPIVVGAGQAVAGLTLRLWRGAVIAGVLRDEDGKPRENVLVSAVPAKAGTGSSILTLSNNGVRTNDLGEFRIFGLEPGAYVVAAQYTVAQPPGSAGPQMIGLDVAAVDAALAALRRRAVGGAPAASPSVGSQKSFDYSPVFFPGTAQLAQAAVITLAAGDERVDVNFALRRVTTSTVDGIVLRPDGTPAGGARLQMTAAASTTFTSLPQLQLNATAALDGRFRISQVAPGDYVLLARAPQTAPPPAPTGSGDTVMVMPANAGSGPSLWATTNLSIAGTDISNLALSLQPGSTVTGKVVFDGEGPAPTSFSLLVVAFEEPGFKTMKPGSVITSIAFKPGAQVKADGSFEVSGLAPGTFQMAVYRSTIPATWWVRSAMAGDRDLLDGLITFAPASTAAGVVLTFSDHHTELSGSLQTPTGAPASDVFVIAYAADRRFWGPASRRVVAVRPGVDGKFVIPDLPRGDYLISAVTDADQGDWQDPAFLDKLVTSSVKVTIGEGEKVVQNLRLGGG